jgi:hypothetical protein
MVEWFQSMQCYSTGFAIYLRFHGMGSTIVIHAVEEEVCTTCGKNHDASNVIGAAGACCKVVTPALCGGLDVVGGGTTVAQMEEQVTARQAQEFRGRKSLFGVADVFCIELGGGGEAGAWRKRRWRGEVGGANWKRCNGSRQGQADVEYATKIFRSSRAFDGALRESMW